SESNPHAPSQVPARPLRPSSFWQADRPVIRIANRKNSRACFKLFIMILVFVNDAAKLPAGSPPTQAGCAVDGIIEYLTGSRDDLLLQVACADATDSGEIGATHRGVCPSRPELPADSYACQRE